MVAFQSLGELSGWLDTNPGVEIVDPGVPLTDFFDGADVPALDVLRKHPSVRKVTGFIARSVASVPMNLYERAGDTDRTRILDHPLARALSEPMPRLTQYRFQYDLMMDRLLYDKSCFLWTLSDTGDLTFTRIPAHRFTVKADTFGVVEKIVTNDGHGKKIEFPPEQCVIDVGYHPGKHNGLSTVRTLQDVLAESREAVDYRRSIWRNGARVAQVVERPAEATWSPEAREKFQHQLSNYRKNAGSDGGWMLLEDGMQLKEVTSFRPRDTLDLDGRRLTDEEVASAFYVPPELVGAREGTYSNIEAFRSMLYRDVVGPWILANEQSINVQLTKAVAGGRPLYVEANIEAKLRGDFNDQASILQTSTGAPWLTRNEARARMNLPAIDGGDELVTPLNVTIGGQASPTDSAPKENQ